MNTTNYMTFTIPFTTPVPSNETLFTNQSISTSISGPAPTVGDLGEFGHFKGGAYLKFLK